MKKYEIKEQYLRMSSAIGTTSEVYLQDDEEIIGASPVHGPAVIVVIAKRVYDETKTVSKKTRHSD